MAKPKTRAGYDEDFTKDCERVLVTLLRGLGPWKESVYLIGGLTPRYLVQANPPSVPRHAGTLDVDIVVDLELLVDTEAYHTLAENLSRMGFERAENYNRQKISWRWQAKTDAGARLFLEFLADAPDVAGGRVEPLPTKGAVSALNIPHASIVFDLHQVVAIEAELLGDNGVATEKIRHADIVSFTCLKALAFDQRGERKDAHDLIYCLEYASGGLAATAQAFAVACAGTHGSVVKKALGILRARFTQVGDTEGYRKDGPVAVAKFELGDDPQNREARILRQRRASDVVVALLAKLA